MKNIFNRRGQALIESVVATLALSILLMGSLSTLYFCFSKLWLRHFTHEAIICLASLKAPGVCQNQFIKNMHAVLPFGRLMIDEFFISPSHLDIHARWSFGMNESLDHKSHFRISEHQMLNLPLKGDMR